MELSRRTALSVVRVSYLIRVPKWRYLLCKALRQAQPHDPDLQHAITQGYHDHRGFQVYTESFYPKGLDAAKYIGRYLGHPPLATSHLTGYDGHQIIF
jgi:Putative transposase